MRILIIIICIQFTGCVTYNPELIELKSFRSEIFAKQAEADIFFVTAAQAERKGIEAQVFDMQLDLALEAKYQSVGKLTPIDVKEALKTVREGKAERFRQIDEAYQSYLDAKKETAQKIQEVEQGILKTEQKQSENNKAIWQYVGQVAAILATSLI